MLVGLVEVRLSYPRNERQLAVLLKKAAVESGLFGALQQVVRSERGIAVYLPWDRDGGELPIDLAAFGKQDRVAARDRLICHLSRPRGVIFAPDYGFGVSQEDAKHFLVPGFRSFEVDHGCAPREFMTHLGIRVDDAARAVDDDGLRQIGERTDSLGRFAGLTDQILALPRGRASFIREPHPGGDVFDAAGKATLLQLGAELLFDHVVDAHSMEAVLSREPPGPVGLARPGHSDQSQ